MRTAEKMEKNNAAQERIDRAAYACFGAMIGSEIWESTTITGLAKEAYDAAEKLEKERAKRIAAAKEQSNANS